MAEVKEVAETLQAIVTIAALLVGGAWTYMLFIQKRQRFPRAEVTHEVLQVGISESHVLYHVAAKIANTGEVLVPLVSAETRIQQLVPPPKAIADALAIGEDPIPHGQAEVQWPLLGFREWTWKAGTAEIEPGESEVLTSDFLVPRHIECVEIYTYVPNSRKADRAIGWSRTTICHSDRTSNVHEESGMKDIQKPPQPKPQLPPKPRPPGHSDRQLPPKERPPRPEPSGRR